MYINLNAYSHIKYLNYQIDGKDYSSYLVKPKGNTKGNIFIIHDWKGLNKYINQEQIRWLKKAL